MTSLITLFRKNVDTVVEDDRKATDTLVQQLKRSTPQNLLRRGPEVWSHLTMSQYRDIVETIAPDVHLPIVNEERPEAVSMLEKIGDWWRERSTLTRSFYLTTIMTVTIVTGSIAIWPMIVLPMAFDPLVRDINVGYWPPCGRLAGDTDGCVYIPTQDLNWEWIANHVAIPVEKLLKTNYHLPAAYAPRGSKVTIWRSRGQLVRKMQ